MEIADSVFIIARYLLLLDIYGVSTVYQTLY